MRLRYLVSLKKIKQPDAKYILYLCDMPLIYLDPKLTFLSWVEINSIRSIVSMFLLLSGYRKTADPADRPIRPYADFPDQQAVGLWQCFKTDSRLRCPAPRPGTLSGVDPQDWLPDALARIVDHKINKLDALMLWSNAQVWT